MLNIKSGSILTNGLGGPAYNLLMFGPVNLYIEPYTEPPPPEPTPTPPAEFIGHPGGAAAVEEDKKYKLTFVVKITKRKRVEKSFIIDENNKDIIIRRIGKINTSIIKFKVTFRKLKKVFMFKWKK